MVVWIRIWKVRFPFLCEETHFALLAHRVEIYGPGGRVEEGMDIWQFLCSKRKQRPLLSLELIWETEKGMLGRFHHFEASFSRLDVRFLRRFVVEQ